VDVEVIWVKRTPEYFCEKGWTPSRRFARRNDQNRIQHGSSTRFAWRSMRRPRRAGSLSNFSHVKSIGSFWTEIYQETMVSHVYYTGGDVDNAIQVLTEANAVLVD
jgi:hypothetical protein